MSNEATTQFAVGHTWFPAMSYNTYLVKPEEQDKFKPGITLDTVVQETAHINKLDDGKHLYRYAMEFKFRAVSPMEDKNYLVFDAAGLIRGDIIMDDEHDLELLKNFIKANQNIIAYPYIRTNVDGMLNKAGLPSLSMIIFY
ncbi:hypothetical protein [Calditerrivibrio nitroreducens]|uniref:Uncharacterized protein n=1 Tax=Calditerrivibrio nitroreducens (strain DSM 19672 / NBRC 101217 / Yu37-1) TaxID=768670 RepID=E4TJ84_CALNY|nr:hypothetical protein [Calditerrivibrio nitroreducens]ADR18120.1 hypothetical protein Calni_0207 [Calditerrivibrio nitroreducens DSM 19672]